MSQQSLSTLVAIYRRKHGPRIAAYLDYFAKLESLEDAIQFACHGKDGKIHSHQYLVGKVKLEQARKVLQRYFPIPNNRVRMVPKEPSPKLKSNP